MGGPKRKRLIKPENIAAVADELLGSYFCLPEIRAPMSIERLHDDYDGTKEGKIIVTMSVDGDMWVQISQPAIGHDYDDPADGPVPTTRSMALRFRMPLCGGGQSHHTRNALVLLARAIQLDNERRETIF